LLLVQAVSVVRVPPPKVCLVEIQHSTPSQLMVEVAVEVLTIPLVSLVLHLVVLRPTELLECKVGQLQHTHCRELRVVVPLQGMEAAAVVVLGLQVPLEVVVLVELAEMVCQIVLRDPQFTMLAVVEEAEMVQLQEQVVRVGVVLDPPLAMSLPQQVQMGLEVAVVVLEAQLLVD
jgi:hypothetical protein